MGIGDVFGAIIAIILSFNPSILPRNIVIYAAGYLILKGGFFAISGNFVSYLDVLCGIYIVLLSYSISLPILTIIVVVFLIQKNVVAFVSQ